MLLKGVSLKGHCQEKRPVLWPRGVLWDLRKNSGENLCWRTEIEIGFFWFSQNWEFQKRGFFMHWCLNRQNQCTLGYFRTRNRLASKLKLSDHVNTEKNPFLCQFSHFFWENWLENDTRWRLGVPKMMLFDFLDLSHPRNEVSSGSDESSIFGRLSKISKMAKFQLTF